MTAIENESREQIQARDQRYKKRLFELDQEIRKSEAQLHDHIKELQTAIANPVKMYALVDAAIKIEQRARKLCTAREEHERYTRFVARTTLLLGGES